MNIETLIMKHKECDGKVDVEKAVEAEIYKYKHKNFYQSKFLPLFCIRCKSKVWVDLIEIGNITAKILNTALDGKNRKITDRGILTDDIRTFNDTYIDYLDYPSYKKIKVFVHQKKTATGKEVRKTTIIKDLKEKLAKVEQDKKKARETIKELKEKLAKAEQAKMEPEKIYCPECGTQLISIEPFCSSCGANVEERIRGIKETPSNQ